MKQIISTEKAPAAIGPYAQGVAAGKLIITSGQLPLDPPRVHSRRASRSRPDSR